MFKVCVFLVTAAVLVGCCYGVEMATILDKCGCHLTSSTLEWVALQAGQTPPSHALAPTEGGPLWCRAELFARMLAGAVVDSTCHIPFIGKVFQMNEYEVLVSINESARVVTVDWNNLQAIPSGGIATPNVLLAIAKTEEVNILPGYVNVQTRRAYVLKDGKFHEQTSAIILTEDEPIHYIVDQIVINENQSQIVTSEEVVSKTILRNPTYKDQLVSEIQHYTDKEVIFLGLVTGTVTGLNATVTAPSGNTEVITWGCNKELDHLEEQRVQYELPAFTWINVKLIGVTSKYEAPYSARLTAVYEDGEHRSRTITGLLMHKQLIELRDNFSIPYYFSNKTKIEGEFATSQILIYSTTTRTTTTTTPSPEEETISAEKSDSLATTTDRENKLPIPQQMGVGDTSSTLVPELVILLCCSLLLTHYPAF